MDRNVLNRPLACVLFAVAGFALPAVAQDTKPAEKPAEKAAEPKKEEAKTESKKLVVGMDAPKVDVEKFLKGDAVKEYKKGHVYVVEFWATWCGPCKVSIPHLTKLQKEYKDKATIIGVNVWEDREYSASTITKAVDFVKEMGDEMNYTVAFDGAAKKMDEGFMKASGARGIPTAFIVDQNAKIAYIGHPSKLDKVLKEVIDGTFDMKKATEDAAKSKANEGKAAEIMAKMEKAMGEGKTDEAMKLVDDYVALGGDMASGVAQFKFNYLAEEKSDYKAAAAYATQLAEGIFKNDQMMLNQLSWTMVDPEGDFEKKYYDEAMKIAQRAVDVSGGKDAAILDTLARCYWGKGDKAKAIEIQKKAVAVGEGEMKAQVEETLKEYESDGKDANNPDGTR